MKIKVGDKVLVTTGKYKGKTGNIQRVFQKTGKIVIEKINLIIKHVKKTSSRKGEKVTLEAPFDASNVMVICPSCSKAVRVGYSVPKEGKKYRSCKKCNAPLDSNKVIRKERK